MTRPTLPRARVAATFLFATLGLLVGGWLSRIPDVKHDLGVGDARWGALSTFGSLGSLAAMLAAAVLIVRLGTHRMTVIGVPAMLLAMPLLASSGSIPHLIVGFVIWGMASGLIQTPINSTGILVERVYRRPIMSGVHAGFSLGTLAGALIGAAAVRLGLAPGVQLLIESALLAAAFVVVAPWLPNDRRPSPGGPFALAAPDPDGEPPLASAMPDQPAARDQRAETTQQGCSDRPGQAARPRVPGQLILLAAIGFCSAVGEGTSSQWAAIYTRQVLDATPSTAALVYATFAASMSLGRVTGDRLVHLLGRRRFLVTVPLLCAIGLGSGLLVGTVWSTMFGFACAGLGLSCITPTVFGAAGNLPGLAPGRGLSVMNVASWPAFLTAPILVGAIADIAGLRVGLFVVVGAAALAAALATRLRFADR